VSGESPQRGRARYIPDEDSLVPAAADEAIVGVGDCDIEDLVAVGRVGLQLLEGAGVEDPDLAVGRAGEDVRAGAGAVSQGVDLAWKC